jgi:putative aldouronate transport system permease protein
MRRHIKPGALIADIAIYAVMIFAGIITLYPFIYVLSMSFSGSTHIIKMDVWLWPKSATAEAYRRVLESENLWTAYGNTIYYTVVGTLINVVMTVLAAYPLSRPKFFFRNHFMFFFAFTMFFGGGLIPLFILVNKLGLYNTRWAMILPTAVGVWYIIIARTYFQTIPESLFEAVTIDGGSELYILEKVVVPLSKPIIAVLTLYYAVGHWNQYFAAMVFLPSQKLQPLQLFLVDLLIQAEPNDMLDTADDIVDKAVFVAQLKYAAIIVAILPIICLYPLLQKYFIKGVMIGAIKG